MSDDKLLEAKKYLEEFNAFLRERFKDSTSQLAWEVMDFRKTLTTESDRAAALMSAAYLDERKRPMNPRGILVCDVPRKK